MLRSIAHRTRRLLSRLRGPRHSKWVFRAHELPLPGNDSREAILDALSSLTIDNVLIPELRSYLEADLDRFLYTLDLVEPDLSGRALEIGSNPYFASALMRTYRPKLRFDYLNYFEGSGDRVRQQVAWKGVDGKPWSIDADCFNVNIEASPLPVADETYDMILFCEVLEHFTMNPLMAVRELSRVLKPGGKLVLTTPNVARAQNVVAFLEGRNMYDPYSGYGPHGRHNREYTRHELHQLMNHAGFTCDRNFTSDVHAHPAPTFQSPNDVLALLGGMPHRENDLGQYLFSRWTKTSPAREDLPRWLYRSYPEERMAP